MKYDMDSKVKDVYSHPLGKDIINKLLLQLNKKRKLVENPIISSRSLSFLRRIAGKRVSDGFWEAVLALLNNDLGDLSLITDPDQQEPCWWKEAVFYQIYPKSFMDSNGDGIGDIQGIISKLDYLKELGVDAIWLCPVYDSPQDDNGYDIRDYQKIDQSYGSMEDFDQLLDEVHKREMRLIMDLVINHTSDEHAWFKQAVTDPDSKYHDYYYIQKGQDNSPSNNWTSFFSGPAWKQLEDGDWALKLFSNKQMDLNWENQELREDIYEMVRWWLEKGIDGFRLDVINYISKAPGLPDGDEMIGELMGFRGIEHYFHGPKLHQYLHELHEKAFAPYDAFSVGETPGIGLETGKLLTAPGRKELDMMFSFDHLENPGKAKFDEYVYDPVYLKDYYTEWMEYFSPISQMSLFYDNHDNPRMLSKIDPGGEYRVVLAKLLGMMQMTLKGTPFLYQGQELGAVNAGFTSMGEIMDVESLNLYKELSAKMPREEVFRKIMGGTRDHARVPMKWDNSANGGFTTGSPWLRSFPDRYNAAEEEADQQSVLNFYKNLIGFRREHRELIYGDIRMLPVAREIFAYTRGDKLRIVLNLSKNKNGLSEKLAAGKIVMSNYPKEGNQLEPYEGRIYLR
ncbi:MAG: alpha-glucosidase [Lachnospiraceae bacterium]